MVHIKEREWNECNVPRKSVIFENENEKKNENIQNVFKKKIKLKTNDLFVMKEIENRFEPPLHDEWFTIQSGSIREIGSNAMNKNGNCRKDISFGHLAS